METTWFNYQWKSNTEQRYSHLGILKKLERYTSQSVPKQLVKLKRYLFDKKLARSLSN